MQCNAKRQYCLKKTVRVDLLACTSRILVVLFVRQERVVVLTNFPPLIAFWFSRERDKNMQRFFQHVSFYCQFVENVLCKFYCGKLKD